MPPIIRVDNLSKRYRIGALQRSYFSARESLMNSLVAPFQRRRSEAESSVVWALRDVSFAVQPGEVVGIIGSNGAGKSTLLKILSGITKPTVGRAELYGRVSSLLEVGTGFHPELTGRENVFLNGAILGMRREEVKRHFDSIVAFAEIAPFIDTAVKHYSSGMYVRLAFAVAAHLEPEILIVDEVLSVGDAQFQRKCLGVMDQAAHTGRTVLFVSHNLSAVNHLCRRGIVMVAGRIKFDGTQTEAVANYLTGYNEIVSLRDRTDRAGSGEMRVVAVSINDAQGRALDEAVSGQEIDICLDYESAQGFQSSRVIAGICIKTQLDAPVFLQHNRLTRVEWGALPARGSLICRIPKLPLPPSNYRLTFSLMDGSNYLDTMDNAFELKVAEGDFFGTGEVPPATHGCCLVEAEWRLEAEGNHRQQLGESDDVDQSVTRSLA
ncbi:MAG: ABC transporter ATP-binding protein [Acidobacteriota bacterium]